MRHLESILLFLGLCGLIVFATAGDASAQRRGRRAVSSSPSSTYRDGVDISASYGWMWGGNIDAVYNARSGKFRWASAPSWFFAVEIPMRPGMQLQLQYTLQDTQLDWDPNGGVKEKYADMTVNYWQIGATAGLPRGRIMPYTMLTVGATYWSFSNDRILDIKNQTKFSFTAGVGAKTYFGQNQKVGLRVQFRVLPTFYNTFATIGTGGVGISGNAIWQWEIGGGLSVKF